MSILQPGRSSINVRLIGGPFAGQREFHGNPKEGDRVHFGPDITYQLQWNDSELAWEAVYQSEEA